MRAPSLVIAWLSWMPSRIALVLRDSSFASRFLRSSRGSGHHLHVSEAAIAIGAKHIVAVQHAVENVLPFDKQF